MRKTIGFIGLGNMGGGMAKNLLSAGYPVVAYDTVKDKLSGFTEATNVSEVGEKCSVVIVCLPSPDASKEVILDHLAKLENVSTIIETSTLTPEIVTDFAMILKELNKNFISAPMVGGKGHAASGEIDFLVEGDESDFNDNLSVFEAMGKAQYMGDIPSATLAKLTFNLCRYANLAVAVEAYRLLKPYGANTRAIHEFISEQSLDNFGQVWAEDMKDMMTKDIPFQPSQVPKKDLALLTEMAESHEVDPEIIKAVRNTYLSMESPDAQ